MRSNVEIIEIALNPKEVDELYDLAMLHGGARDVYEASCMLEDIEWLSNMVTYDRDGGLFENAYIAVTNWDERAYQSSDYSLRLPRNYSERDVIDRWEEFGDIYIDSYGTILKQFYGFPPGTPREDVWKAFENAGLNIGSALYREFSLHRRF